MEHATAKVLVIDDEAAIRGLIRRGLGGAGYEVKEAESGVAAVEAAKTERFDVALCDLKMPVMDGLATLKALKELQPGIEVVMVTGIATFENAVEAMRRGAYDYIPKPFEFDQIRAVVARAAERARLRAKVDELEQLNRLKSEFLANMSHELRTPLNAIVGYSSLILEEIYGEVPPAQAQALSRVLVNSKNLLALINNILDYSKLNAGMMPTHIEEFDLTGLIREVAEMMHVLADEKRLSLNVEAEEMLLVRSDKTKIKQILINLLGNAIKFSDKGGVTVRAALEGKDGVALSVRDTGPGIAPQDLPRLFQDFKQLDGAATRKFGGTGLGLSITKKLAELLGGTVAVVSELGRGTIFTVRMAQSVVPQDSILAAPVAAGANKILLAIDDDPEVLRLVRDSLTGTSYTMAGASSGDEGLALARKLKPAVITLDIMMPHRDGWSVLQALKSDPDLKMIPVVILSIMENKALGFSLGVADYIVKPFERRVLLEKLSALEAVSGKRVLVVDDEPGVRELIELGLTSEGYSVKAAATGAAALAALESTTVPDVMFLDLNLPDMNGFEILGKIEKNRKYRNMRVFILTGRTLGAPELAELDRKSVKVIEKGSISLTAILESLMHDLQGAAS